MRNVNFNFTAENFHSHLMLFNMLIFALTLNVCSHRFNQWGFGFTVANRQRKRSRRKDTSKCHGATFTDLAAEESFSWMQLVTNSQRGQSELKVSSNQYCDTIRMEKKVDMLLTQDRTGNKNWLCWKNRCWGRKLGRVSVWAPSLWSKVGQCEKKDSQIP